MERLTDLHLVQLQLELEGIGIDAQGRLIRIPAEATEPIPRLFVCHHGPGWTRFYRSDVPAAVVDDLGALSDQACFIETDRVRSILARHQPSPDVWIGTSYVFSEAPSAPTSLDVTRLERLDLPLATGLDPDVGSGRGPVFCIIVDGRIVSTCISARENDAAAEAWVQTSPEYRHRGFARQVTGAWARDIVGRVKVAFYSHRRENRASRGVAASLGLRRYIDGAGYL